LYGAGAVPDASSSAFCPPHVAGLDVYQPGKPLDELERELGITGAIKVASNENPLGPSPRVIACPVTPVVILPLPSGNGVTGVSSSRNTV